MIINYSRNLESIRNSSKALKSNDKVDKESIFVAKDNNNSKEGNNQYFEKRADDIARYFSLIQEMQEEIKDNFYKHIKYYNEALDEMEKDTLTTNIIA